MENQKLENLLNLSLDATSAERDKSPDLSAGYNSISRTWTLIIKYTGSLSSLESMGITPVLLYGQYAIIEVPQTMIDTIASLPEIVYIEKPKDLYFTILQGRSASCVSPVQSAPFSGLNLLGRGCIIGVVDSGIDYSHPVFRNSDGTTRIIGIWDQTVSGNPPDGYFLGTYFDKEQIDQSLRTEIPLNTTDNTGHGTSVASIAAGNFSTNPDTFLGMAPQSQLLVVKLGRPTPGSFPRTSELMQAINFIVQKSIELQMPLALNLSFGNNYGSHKGNSLLETYIDQVASLGTSSIVIGTGNEGNSGTHNSGIIKNNQTAEVEFYIAPYELSLNIQLWKNYYDIIKIEIQSPDGNQLTFSTEGPATYRYRLGGTELLVYYGEPNPYNILQEIYINLLPVGTYLTDGLWKIIVTGVEVIQGEYQLWLPVQKSQNGSRFVTPDPYGSLTIPATTSHAIAVGAYDSNSLSYASFSGRGYSVENNFYGITKPDLVAPGVDITAAVPGNLYAAQSGTSMAAPFVTGAAAMLMEWGIIQNNDPFLYGEKLKAFLLRGAKPLPGITNYPNPLLGYGALCVKDSLPSFALI